MVVPISFETLGQMDTDTAAFIKRLVNIYSKQQATGQAFNDYLLQCISIEIQRGNAVSILKTTGEDVAIGKIYNIFRYKIVL